MVTSYTNGHLNSTPSVLKASSMSAEIFFSAAFPAETYALASRQPLTAKAGAPTPRARHHHLSPDPSLDPNQMPSASQLPTCLGAQR